MNDLLSFPTTIGCAIIQLPELILFLHEFIKKGYAKKSLPGTNSPITSNRTRENNSVKPMEGFKSLSKNMRSSKDIVNSIEAKSFDTNAGVEEKLRHILERIDRQELRFNNFLNMFQDIDH